MDLSNKNVVFLWHAGASPDAVRDFVWELQGRIGSGGQVHVENAERLKACKLTLNTKFGFFFGRAMLDCFAWLIDFGDW